MSKIVYCLLIVTLATLITARPGDDKKPADPAKDAKGAGDKAKAGAEDAAKKLEGVLKGGDKKPNPIGIIAEDMKKESEDGMKMARDAIGVPIGMVGSLPFGASMFSL